MPNEIKLEISDLCIKAEAYLESKLETDLMNATILAEEAYEKSMNTNYEEGIAKCSLLFGMLKYKTKDFSDANEYFESCLTICNKNHYLDIHTKVLQQLGDLRLEVNDFESALEYYLNCLKISNQEKEIILLRIGFIYKELEQYNIAIEYFEEVVDLSISKEVSYSLSKAYSYLAECYINEGGVKEAGMFIKKAINTAIENSDDFDFGYAYMVYAKYHFLTGELKESIAFFEKSIYKFTSLKMLPNLLETMTEYGIMLYESDQYEAAEQILTEASNLLLKERSLKAELKVYLYLAKIHERNKQYDRALSYFKRFNDIKTVNDETWKNIKVKNIINKYEYLRTDIKVKELTNINENLVVLSKLGREITSTLKQNEIIEKINKSIFQLIKCDSFGVGFINKGNVLDYTIYNNNNESKKLTYNFDNKDNHLANLLQKTEGSIDNDILTISPSTQVLDYSVIGMGKINSVMSSPLIFENEAIGLIDVHSYYENTYAENDLEILKILSAYITIALNNCNKSQTLIDTNRKLKELTEKDGLTKVYNRYSLNTNASKIIQRAKKYKKPYSVVMIDVDFFKEYNDNYGHLAGDQCLIAVSNVLNKICAKEKSFIYRYGGDEFLVIIMNKEPSEAKEIAERMRKGIVEMDIEHHFSKCADVVTLTIGVVTLVKKMDDYIKIFAIADNALYIAKNSGRNNVNHIIHEE
jgi:diguanylate cyclase (GGDEF)-like protein